MRQVSATDRVRQRPPAVIMASQSRQASRDSWRASQTSVPGWLMIVHSWRAGVYRCPRLGALPPPPNEVSGGGGWGGGDFDVQQLPPPPTPPPPPRPDQSTQSAQ